MCKTHAVAMPAAPHVYAKVEGCHTPEVQRSKEPSVEIYIIIHQYTKEYSLGYIHAVMPTGKLTPHRRSLGLSAWNPKSLYLPNSFLQET